MTQFVAIMLDQLMHPDANMRGQAAVALAESCEADALHGLLARVGREPDLNVREDITWALVRMGEKAVAPLIALLGDGDAAVRHHAAHTLGKIGDPRAIPALADTLQDGDLNVVSKTAFVLGQIGDAAAVPALAGLIGHADSEVQTAAGQALEAFGAAAMPALLVALRSDRWQTREHAAEILGALQRIEAVDRLAEAASDEHPHVRLAAVTALGEVGGAAAQAALEQAKTHPDERVQTLAARLIVRLSRRRPA
jgi:HEAT repeat protein